MTLQKLYSASVELTAKSNFAGHRCAIIYSFNLIHFCFSKFTPEKAFFSHLADDGGVVMYDSRYNHECLSHTRDPPSTAITSLHSLIHHHTEGGESRFRCTVIVNWIQNHLIKLIWNSFRETGKARDVDIKYLSHSSEHQPHIVGTIMWNLLCMEVSTILMTRSFRAI